MPLTPEQIARLSPEELVVAEKWEREKEERGRLIELFSEAEKAGDQQKASEFLRQALDTSDMCEHDRSIWSPCSACHNIEMKLHPELFDEEGEPIDWCPMKGKACQPPESWDGEFPFVCVRCKHSIAGLGG